MSRLLFVFLIALSTFSLDIQAYANLLKANIDNLKKRDRKKTKKNTKAAAKEKSRQEQSP